MFMKHELSELETTVVISKAKEKDSTKAELIFCLNPIIVIKSSVHINSYLL